MTCAHPRRTTKTTSSPVTPTSGRPMVNTNMTLRKGATFHSPSSASSTENTFALPSLLRRSETTLEDVVDAHRRRVALRLGDIDIDRRLSNTTEASLSTSSSYRDESIPVPQGFLNHSAIDDVAQELSSSYNIGKNSLRSRNRRSSIDHHHDSDSGLGSSIMSVSENKTVDKHTSTVEAGGAKASVSASAITRSAAAPASSMERLPRLSARASNRIQEHILRPLLAKPSLKDFHPIIRDCPRRIHQKEIVCLRDLEKTLIFMAPVSDLLANEAEGSVAHWFLRCVKERTKTIDLYLEFCLRSIRCIQATVEFISEREQTRPHDRPYTNGYFVDLVDQIRQYAQQVQETREKEANGEEINEMDAACTDEVKLYGGMTRNGRPAELVRINKNGKAISIATGQTIDVVDDDVKDESKMKRSFSDEEDEDESVLRSMARRKKNATPEELAPKPCREPGCNKKFKRPCDLTKHEKTHTRPFKCPHLDCKFHDQGWPTEKELDRHVNDKHSLAPKFFECQYHPCPYKSKRESNCKQHMEKTHGWTYVKSKSNGKNRSSAPAAHKQTPSTVSMSTPSTDPLSIPTPTDGDDFPMQDSVMYNDVYDDNSEIELGFKPVTDLDIHDPTMPMPPFQSYFSPVDTNLSNTPFLSPSTTSPHQLDITNDFNIDDPAFNAFSNTVDFDLFPNEDLYSARAQLPTPSNSIFRDDYGTTMPHISPVGQGNTMLYTPSSACVDEFDEYNMSDNGGNDFTLYPTTDPAHQVNTNGNNGLFGEVPSSVAGFANSSTQEFLQTLLNHHQASMEWTNEDFYTENYSDRQ